MMRVALVYAGQMADTVAVLMMSSRAGNEGVADQLCTLRANKMGSCKRKTRLMQRSIRIVVKKYIIDKEKERCKAVARML